MMILSKILIGLFVMLMPSALAFLVVTYPNPVLIIIGILCAAGYGYMLGTLVLEYIGDWLETHA